MYQANEVTLSGFILNHHEGSLWVGSGNSERRRSDAVCRVESQLEH